MIPAAFQDRKMIPFLKRSGIFLYGNWAADPSCIRGAGAVFL
ncbi:hypothetical protein HMPREF9436_00319 [Faecalibacterium cf. prausnitzii KLE1255]|uniref:Uncharacterized protein n=1 Tax=Faecalibacterium cf. prausnitzii KLE1255 TaxID=748224 RepID=E2ZF86_9FIRM|nr:hypothetical protein HMPREF9436_00319 [Faecalibacterium cf. prausnitzii KLE1255]